jgi:hypothetical protein
MYLHTISYLIGLVICAISIGALTETAPYGFLIFGGGLILHPIFTQIINLLSGSLLNKKKE